jgi:hypothetical protein
MCHFEMLQVQLLQKHDADLEKSIQALAADVSSKVSHGAQSVCCTRTHSWSNQHSFIFPPSSFSPSPSPHSRGFLISESRGNAQVTRENNSRSFTSARVQSLRLKASLNVLLQADLASSRAECTSLKSLVEQVARIFCFSTCAYNHVIHSRPLQLRTRRLSDGGVRGTPAKPAQRPSSSPPRGASPALSRAPSDSLSTPTLQNLRRPADFGSPGVAVASASAASRSSATSLRAQDDAMEMLLQVPAPLCSLEYSRRLLSSSLCYPRRFRSLQAHPSMQTRGWTWCGSSCR